ncbi:MAG: sulfatase-like hydrolase/transferase [Gemmatimonadota bacterium]|nr:sulfatase-like hydrolase/transferase [Gemmatimonadota bacterium]
MRRRDLTRLLVIAFVASIASDVVAQPNARTGTRPNVVLILMDDLGYGDLGSYGAKDARTPNLDRLAREGVRLTDAYANAPNCSPTRAGLISGQYQQRYGIEWPLGAVPGDTARGLPATGATLPALLKKTGYATGLIGKWHLGFKPEFGPNAHGFDEFFGFLSATVGYYSHRRGEGTPDLYENTTLVEIPGYLTDEITRRAVRFVDRHSTDPFFLEVAYNATHWPFDVPDLPPTARHEVHDPAAPGGLKLYQGPTASVPATRGDYVRMLERADRGVGEILSALERRGLTRNTLVIFTSDNGGEWLSRNAPLRNRKGTLWEGGVRVPFILRWPGYLPANKSSAQVAMTMDLTASILAATGAAIPAGHKLDGLDLLPSLSGRTPIVEREIFWRIKRPFDQRAARSGRWKLVQEGRNFFLFDMSADPGELNDLTAAHPGIVRRLNGALDAWEEEVGPQQGGAP